MAKDVMRHSCRQKSANCAPSPALEVLGGVKRPLGDLRVDHFILLRLIFHIRRNAIPCYTIC